MKDKDIRDDTDIIMGLIWLAFWYQFIVTGELIWIVFTMIYDFLYILMSFRRTYTRSKEIK